MTMSDYPPSLEMDYDDSSRNRLTVFFRGITVIPILLIVIGLQTIANARENYARFKHVSPSLNTIVFCCKPTDVYAILP